MDRYLPRGAGYRRYRFYWVGRGKQTKMRREKDGLGPKTEWWFSISVLAFWKRRRRLSRAWQVKTLHSFPLFLRGVLGDSPKVGYIIIYADYYI